MFNFILRNAHKYYYVMYAMCKTKWCKTKFANNSVSAILQYKIRGLMAENNSDYKTIRKKAELGNMLKPLLMLIFYDMKS